MALRTYQVCVYGGSFAAAMAACASAQRGATTLLVAPDSHIGYPFCDGLGVIDAGKYGTHGIGWLTEEFFNRLSEYVGSTTELFLRASPHMCDTVLSEMLRFYGVDIYVGQPVTTVSGNATSGAAITTITLADTQVVTASCYIDADVDADLQWKAASVTSRLGRESVAEAHASEADVAGYRPSTSVRVVDTGDGLGGLLPGVMADPGLAIGAADLQTQVFTYRVNLTSDPRNRLPWPKPAGYDTTLFELRWRMTPITDGAFRPFQPATGNRVAYGKFDWNDNVGYQYQAGWATASSAARATIMTALYNEQAGYAWRLANDPAVHADIREFMATWGLCKDEHVYTGSTIRGWPKQIYRRSTRRLANPVYKMVRADTQTTITKADGCSMGFYSLDHHSVAQIAKPGGFVYDGFSYTPGVTLQVTPYEIPFSCMVTAQCPNLISVYGAGCSYVAQASMRIDLWNGQMACAAGWAAAESVLTAVPVQSLDNTARQTALTALGQVLHYVPPS